MSIPPPTPNIGQSVFARLLNIAKQSGETHQYLLTRYAIERLLYRLSASEYRDQFILKGGILLQAWQGQNHRTTRDVDFLGIGTSKIAEIQQIFKAICLTSVPNDGVQFLTDQLKAQEIMEHKRYGAFVSRSSPKSIVPNKLSKWILGLVILSRQPAKNWSIRPI